MEQTPERAELNMAQLDKRIAVLDNRMNNVETTMSRVLNKLDDIERQIMNIRTTDFRIMYGIGIGLVGIMVKGFGWI